MTPSNPKTEGYAAAPGPVTAPAGTRVRGGLALILSILALVASSYLWYTARYADRRLFGVDVRGTLARLPGQTAQIQARLATAEQQIGALQQSSRAAATTLDRITSDFGRHRTEWMLVESEQLLIMANHRLQIARDVPNALAALQSADLTLKLVANPGLLPVRRDLALEIAQLQALEKIDIDGIALQLAALAGNVARLPIALEVQRREAAPAARSQPAGAPAAGTWQKSLSQAWHDLLGLVRIRTDVVAQRPLLPPSQQYFLRQNLRLMLYGAQLALLQGDIATYRRNLDTARRWTREYFDASVPAVAAMQRELDQLRAVEIPTEMPDISASLEALRRVIGPGNTP